MNNIIASDFYRMKKGRNLWVVALVTIGLVLMISSMSIMTSSITTSISTEGIDSADIVELQSDLQEAQTLIDQTTNTAANFINEIMGQNFLFFLFLPIIIAVFCSDFTFETYKNTLSFESNRNKVYMGRFLLTTGLCIVIKVLSIITAFIIGALFIPDKGFSGEFLLTLLQSFFLQLPVYLSVISLSCCFIVFVKKSSVTIASYIMGLMIVSMLLQIIPTLLGGYEWLTLFDPTSAIGILVTPSSLTLPMMVLCIGFYIAVFLISMLVGVKRFQRADLN